MGIVIGILIAGVIIVAIVSSVNNQSRKDNLDSQLTKDYPMGFSESEKIISSDAKACFIIDKTNNTVIVSVSNINGAKNEIINDFSCDKIIEHIKFCHDYYIVAIDKGRRKILLYSINEEKLSSDKMAVKVIGYNDLKSVEMIINNATIFQKSVTRTIGGAVVGNMVAGEAGSVVGGLSGGGTSINAISSIKMRILVKDIDMPSFTFTCLTCDNIRVDSSLIKRDVERAYEIKDTLNAIIDALNSDISKSIPRPESSSLADEIKKLNDLLKIGAISEDEYNKLKSNIINK